MKCSHGIIMAIIIEEELDEDDISMFMDGKEDAAGTIEAS